MLVGNPTQKERKDCITDVNETVLVKIKNRLVCMFDGKETATGIYSSRCTGFLPYVKFLVLFFRTSFPPKSLLNCSQTDQNTIINAFYCISKL